MTTNLLQEIVARNRSTGRGGIPSYCTAHRETLQAIFRLYRATNDPILIEATCNQVNQDGGYTGLTPSGFRDFVFQLATSEGVDVQRIILGGDHLGPNPWKSESAKVAMQNAEVLVQSYAQAGFSKIHLDTSMACADDRELPETTIAARAAALCAVAEKHASNSPPLYVIGTEVPIPGGETDNLEGISVTRPEAPVKTYELHQQAFTHLGLSSALERVIGIVVQPGVDFSNTHVIPFETLKAKKLSSAIKDIPGAVFEAHSTDYQTPTALRDLVTSHFAILKVGPELTAAYREAVVSMAMIEERLPLAKSSNILNSIATVMHANPRHWQGYVTSGPGRDVELLFGLSDRIRYYWPHPEIQSALQILCANIDAAANQTALISQFACLDEKVKASGLTLSQKIIQSRVGAVAEKYCSAC